MTYPSPRSLGTTATPASTNVTINVPSGVVNGDYLIACIRSSSDAAVTCTGWTEAKHSSGNTWRCTVLYRVASSEPASYTFTGTGTLTPCMMVYKDVASIETAGAVAFTAAAGAGSNVTGITVSATTDSLVLLGHAHDANAAAPVSAILNLMQKNVECSTGSGGSSTISSRQFTGGGATGTHQILSTNSSNGFAIDAVTVALAGSGNVAGPAIAGIQPNRIAVANDSSDRTPAIVNSGSVGDIAVCIVGTDTGGVAWDNGWIGLARMNTGAAALKCIVAYMVLDSIFNPGTFNFRNQGSGSGAAVAIWRGVNIVSPLVQRGTAGSASGGGPANAPGITALKDSLIYWICSEQGATGAGLTGVPSGYNQDSSVGAPSGKCFMCSTNAGAGGATGTVSGTLSSPTDWGAQLFEFRGKPSTFGGETLIAFRR